MDEKKSSPDFSETLDWSKIMEEDEQFCADVLSSDRSIIEKINLLRSNPYSCDDIVTEMLLHAPYMENFIEEREVFAPNTSLSEFISTNVNRFDALEACWKELKADEALYKANRRLALDISTAVTIRDIFETDNMVSYVPADCTNVQLVKDFCADALAIVEISAIYFKEAKLKSTNDIISYKYSQKKFLEEYFDVLHPEKKEAPPPIENADEPEESIEANSVSITKEEEKQSMENESITVQSAPAKKTKRKSAVLIIDLIFLAIFAVLTVLAALLNNQAINYILLGSGLVELAVAVILFFVARQRERFTCPNCGTKRVHHRNWVKTTETVKTSNFERVNYPEGYMKTTFKHHYIDTYTCPECGTEMEEKVRKSGGEYTIRNSGHVSDTRREPMEF